MLDLTKPILTRSGQRVRILCSDGPSKCLGVPQPLVGVVEDGAPMCWTMEGYYRDTPGSDLDLVNTPQKKINTWVEVALFRDEITGGFYTDSRLRAQPDRFGKPLARMFVVLTHVE